MKNILVIDDEQDVLEIVRSVLKTKGYTVRCAVGGEDGLRQAEAETPDMIICDLMMPKISGMEVVKRLKKNPAFDEVPIIILSAVAAESDKPEEYWARGLGVDEYICKPFDPLDLIGRVEYLLRRKHYVSANRAGATPMPRRDTPEPPPASRLETAGPSDICAMYVETWNSRDWVTEYNLMGEELVGNYPIDDYVGRRQYAYEQEEQGRSQSVAGYIEEKISGVIAKVVLERKDNMANGRVWMKKCTFTLKKTNKGWKIVRVRDLPLRKCDTQFE